MKYLFSKQSEATLARYAWSRTVLAFDFDGTLAPIVTEPNDATLRASTRSRLITLAQRYPCVVISGRSRADVAARLTGVPIKGIVGNHGVETAESGAMREHAKLVRKWLSQLSASLASSPGIEIEDKRYSLTVHYRRARTKKLARAAIASAIAALKPSARVIGGKQAVNVMPLGALHKGLALERLRSKLGADTAVYVGDDVTDEDVFALDQPGRLMSIRVGKTHETDASHYLKTQSEIDRMLDRLIALRSDPSSHRIEDA